MQLILCFWFSDLNKAERFLDILSLRRVLRARNRGHLKLLIIIFKRAIYVVISCLPKETTAKYLSFSLDDNIGHRVF